MPPAQPPSCRDPRGQIFIMDAKGLSGRHLNRKAVKLFGLFSKLDSAHFPDNLAYAPPCGHTGPHPRCSNEPVLTWQACLCRQRALHLLRHRYRARVEPPPLPSHTHACLLTAA